MVIKRRVHKLRCIGIDTPELDESSGPKCAEANRQLVLRRVVRLEKDVSETDQYGRLLRYVCLGDITVNAELVRLGYAEEGSYPPDVKHDDLFAAL